MKNSRSRGDGYAEKEGVATESSGACGIWEGGIGNLAVERSHYGGITRGEDLQLRKGIYSPSIIFLFSTLPSFTRAF